MANVVQFTGIDNVITAFDSRGTKCWSIWVGNQFLFSFVGTTSADASNELRTLLETLDKTGKGIYTLKVHEDIKKNQKITNKSECHGSFNFRLQQFNPDTEGSRYYNDLRDEVKQLKAQNEQLLSEMEEEPEDEPKGIVDRIGEILLTDPAQLPLIIQSIKSILSMFTSQTTSTGQPQTPVMISGVTGNDPLQQAIDTLKEKDPNLTRHLQKLAQIATNDKPTFDYLVNMLDSIK